MFYKEGWHQGSFRVLPAAPASEATSNSHPEEGRAWANVYVMRTLFNLL